MVLIYALTLFLSATLLFVVQPMFTRMALPLLGGSPMVWNTAQLFFQVMLLAGYLYAHATTKRLGVRKQAALHLFVLLVPLLGLPIGISAGWVPPAEGNPIPWLLALMTVAVGLPFFVVSSTSPMLQTWFAHTRHRAAADPYFLYAASNVGSMLALIAYPAVIEPYVGLRTQGMLWAGGYVLLILLTIACALMLWRVPAGARQLEASPPPLAAAAPAGLSLRRRARWILLAFIPSSLMLSVTTYLTTNIAPIPLLWIIPLALYLLTFILVFAGRPILPHALLVRAFPIVLLPLMIVILAQATQPISLLIALHLLVFFIATMVCHGELARDRPAAAHLTEFYLWLSVGGALGGMFNTLLAPLLFASVLEYPLVLVLACLALPAAAAAPAALRARGWLDLALPAAVGALVVAVIVGARYAGVPPGPLSLGLVFGVPGMLVFSFSRRPLRFALGMAALVLASTLYSGDQGQLLLAERSFFGISRVFADPSGRFTALAHGNTRHGLQSSDPARQREPLMYYYRSGPIGQVFDAYRGDWAKAQIAVIGLGSGALTCYRQPEQSWTYYEIDPSVVHIARDSGYFSYLKQCDPDAKIVLGDARLALAAAADQQYDLIMLDAYSSDSIPIHLITREALDLYQQKLAPGGMLAFHISNLYLDFKPVIGSLAAGAGLTALEQDDLALSAEELTDGKSASQWAIIARDPHDLQRLQGDPRWRPIATPSGAARWTDDYSSVLQVFRWW